ncbi:hypothetical protein PAAG_04163 [Paracoccidioides lutzii Pb01]|uniref:Uncharacterized protein n=1 Tax=Paracoccidioides lutzii (strain ATCC MYA-826 / Pb01) TaxID=502779 RepID=C1H069_PARBA|nr:hypothetical protein PAAG_04163 [Paracoccidioides lutzii Pb01]EEH33110.2 hypothetical protein PAAG_04163 [Paracoccidioides lutzii Pb01]
MSRKSKIGSDGAAVEPPEVRTRVKKPNRQPSEETGLCVQCTEDISQSMAVAHPRRPHAY